MTNANRTPFTGEVPQYRLTAPAYIDDVLYDEAKIAAGGNAAVIYFTGIPGPHMLPLNAAAKEMVKLHKPKHVDLLAGFTTVPTAQAAAPEPPPTPQQPGEPKP